MESGDLYNGFRCWCGSNVLAYCSGYHLDELHQKDLMLLSQLRHYRIDILAALLEQITAMVAHLIGKSCIDWKEIETADPTPRSPSETLRWSYWCWASVQLDLVRLYLEVGEKAVEVSAFVPALSYLRKALESLADVDRPWELHYDMTKRLYRVAADVEFCLGYFEQGKVCYNEVMVRAKSIECLLDLVVGKHVCRKHTFFNE